MPEHLPPVSRRGFLLGTAAAAASVVASNLFSPLALASTADTSVERIALLSDTHISSNPLTALLGKEKAANLSRIVEGVLELRRPPSRVIVNGDCAFHAGLRRDYARFFKLLKPLRQEGLPIHLAMGNHDDRDNVRQALGDELPSLVEDRQVSMIPGRHADLYLLDSLDVTNEEPGRLGEAQLTWLARQLDARPNRAAVVFAHHPPTRIRDERNVLEILSPRRQVKAMFYGHTHNYHVQKHRPDGLHLINLPPTSYVFNRSRPTGWVDLQIHDRGALMALVSLDPTHPQHAEKHDLRWRT